MISNPLNPEAVFQGRYLINSAAASQSIVSSCFRPSFSYNVRRAFLSSTTIARQYAKHGGGYSNQEIYAYDVSHHSFDRNDFPWPDPKKHNATEPEYACHLPGAYPPCRCTRPEPATAHQCYRFHLFGYDPLRMSSAFERIWVGTEARNPLTQRMDYVQPIQGYMNFRWLASVAGMKVEGAWFDDIDCTAQNFVDQAYQGVLAGAHEIARFNLGDIIDGHQGHKLFVTALPKLSDLCTRVAASIPRGIAYYKPPGSEADENLFLMDYLGMLGLPILPEARYPLASQAAFLGVQAAADPMLLNKVRQHLKRGAAIALTPALIRKPGPEAEKLAGV